MLGPLNNNRSGRFDNVAVFTVNKITVPPTTRQAASPDPVVDRFPITARLRVFYPLLTSISVSDVAV